jgi:hypothetical protein
MIVLLLLRLVSNEKTEDDFVELISSCNAENAVGSSVVGGGDRTRARESIASTRATSNLLFGNSSNAYAAYCDEFVANDARSQHELAKQPIVLLHYTSTYMRALFPNSGAEKLSQCTPRDAPTCETDDVLTENLGSVLCRDAKQIPCAAPAQSLLTDLSTMTISKRDTCHGWGLNFDCTVHDHPRALSGRAVLGADALLFDGANSAMHANSQGVFPLQKCRGQSWVFQDWRSVVNYPRFADAAFMSRFDVTIGYSRNYTLWAADVLGGTEEATRAKPVFAARTSSAPLAIFVSNCNALNNRQRFIERLVAALPTGFYHSFGECKHCRGSVVLLCRTTGKCMHNRDVPKELQAANKYREKRRVLQQYKFALAIENSIEKDYITEKVCTLTCCFCQARCA